MSHSCSQCSFTSNFESALVMHRQLHHQSGSFNNYPEFNKSKNLEKSNTVPHVLPNSVSFPPSKGLKLPNRTSSATRLFEKLRSRICRSRTLFAHPEEPANSSINVNNELSLPSECTSKALKLDSIASRCSGLSSMREIQKETYGCHLCSFDTDRITVLDRHLLNYHKIGIENLLKLVMAKTKDGLAEDSSNSAIYGIRQPYYKPPEDIIEEGEFIIETVAPKIKILKHAATNTDMNWTDIPNLKDNCRMLTEELEKMIKYPMENNDKHDFMMKMQTLNEYMCKFVNSSNTLKKVLNKELDSKHVRENHMSDQPYFNLCLDERNSPRDWQRAHSEKMDRSRKKYMDNSAEKSKISSESFYF